MPYILPIISCIILVGIDQIIKYFSILNFGGLQPEKEIISNFFYLTCTGNSGAAWGVFSGARIFFLVSTVVILSCIVYYYIKMPKTKTTKWLQISLVLIFSGAIGNFIDRLLRDGGKVIDMFHCTFWGYYDFPVFNFADILIVFGAIILAIVVLFNKDIDFSIKTKK